MEIAVKNAKKTSILLLAPPQSDEELFGPYKDLSGYFFPLGLAHIASMLKKHNFNVTILDAVVEQMTHEDFRKYLKGTRFDVVGISCFTNTYQNSLDSAKIVREVLPDTLLTLGGVHITSLPQRSFKECPEADILMIGEAEYTFVDLCYQLEKNDRDFSKIAGILYRDQGDPHTLKATTPRGFAPDLDELPLPAYEELNMAKYIPDDSMSKYLPSYSLFASRGCPYPCTFCGASITMGKKPRYKSIDLFIDEVKLLKSRYGAKGFVLQDSTLLLNQPWVADMCRRLIDEKLDLNWTCNARVDQVDEEILGLMKASGCWQIHYGVESGNPETLELLQKKASLEQARIAIPQTQRAGIQASTSYIVGCPGEDEEKSWNTVRFARSLGAEFAIFFIPVPYPATVFYETCRIDGGIREDAVWKDYSSVNYDNPVYINPLIGRERMRTLAYEARPGASTT